jgi:hypothetical protein
MLKCPIIILACSIPRYSLAAPTEVATFAPYHDSFLDAPPPLQFTLEQDNQLQLRNRRFLDETIPTEVHPPIPDKMDRNGTKIRNPSREQLILIKYLIKNVTAGRPYKFGEDGRLHDVPKSPCTVKYYCGKIEVFDEEDYLLYETSCCYRFPHSSAHCCSCDNLGEASLTAFAIICGPCTIVSSFTAMFLMVTNGLDIAGELMREAGSGALKWMKEVGPRTIQRIRDPYSGTPAAGLWIRQQKSTSVR